LLAAWGSGGASPEEVQLKLGKSFKVLILRIPRRLSRSYCMIPDSGTLSVFQQPVLECLVDEENALNIDVRGCCWPIVACHD
jgi:hypothetical protein